MRHAVEPGGDRAGSCRALAVAGGGEKAASELSNSVPGSGGEEGVQEGGRSCESGNTGGGLGKIWSKVHLGAS